MVQAFAELVNTVFRVAIALALMFFITLLHEIGHIVMYRLFSGKKSWSITMGIGKPIFTTERFIINRWFFWGGHVKWQSVPAPKGHMVMWCAGGIIVNIIILTALIFAMPHLSGNIAGISQMAINMNIVVLVITAIPMVYPSSLAGYSGMPSDGMRIYRLLRGAGNLPPESKEQ